MFDLFMLEEGISKEKKKHPRKKKEEMAINVVFVRKGLGAIQMSNDLTLLERKIMNILIYKAQKAEVNTIENSKFKDENGNTFYATTFSELEILLDWKEHLNREKLLESLKMLVKTSLSFNILKNDNSSNKWNIVTSLLAEVRSKNEDDKLQSDIYYYFSPTIKDVIINPKLYAPITLDVQKGIQSRYALALWEYLNSELSIRSTENFETKPIPISDYVFLVAGKKVNYDQFKYINQELIQKPLKEINNKSDLTAEAITHKKGRKVVGISHNISRKEKFLSPLFDANRNEAINQNLSLFKVGLDDFNVNVLSDHHCITKSPENGKINEILIIEKVPEVKRKYFLSKFSENHILENIAEARSYSAKAKTEISVPLIIKAIEENWANSGEEKEKIKRKQSFISELKTLLIRYNGVETLQIPLPSGYIGQNIYFYKLFQNSEFEERYKLMVIAEEDKEKEYNNQFFGCKEYLLEQFKRIDFLWDTLAHEYGYLLQDFLEETGVSEDKLYSLMNLTKQEFKDIYKNLK